MVRMATRSQILDNSGRMWLETISVLPNRETHEEFPQFDAGRRIESVGRLVEDQHLRIVKRVRASPIRWRHAVAEALDIQVLHP